MAFKVIILCTRTSNEYCFSTLMQGLWWCKLIQASIGLLHTHSVLCDIYFNKKTYFVYRQRNAHVYIQHCLLFLFFYEKNLNYFLIYTFFPASASHLGFCFAWLPRFSTTLSVWNCYKVNVYVYSKSSKRPTIYVTKGCNCVVTFQKTCNCRLQQ